MTYSYDPTQIRARGKDQMRFELGDTQTDGGAETCALSDEEYTAIIGELRSGSGAPVGKVPWLMAKLHILEAILFKLSYMVDTKVDVLTYGLGARAERWRKLYEDLRKEIIANTGVPTMDDRAAKKPPYFHTAMKENPRTHSHAVKGFPFRNMTE